MRYSGPIEVHITVEIENTPSERARFQAACVAQNGKSIWIELEQGQTINQPMYGARFSSSVQEQANEIRRLVDILGQDFSITRIKVEAGPYNENIPQSESDARDEPAECYFEHHVALGLKPDTDFDQLKSDLATYDGYLSRNAFKTASKTGLQTRFVTQRFKSIGQAAADTRLDHLLNYAKQLNIEVVDVEREYNIFDSNLHLDKGWMS
ncbi:MAG: hypothetical protein ACPGVT_00020 [Maricaulaceae bacterium]